MSYQRRPITTGVTVCDLCNEVIPQATEASEKGSLTHGYLSHTVTAETKHAWLIWPRSDPRVVEKHYDFHADCIGRLVENAVAERAERES